MDNMQLWLSSSTDSINLNDSAEGFYLNPDLEGLTGLPEIRSVNGLNAGYDGGWTATQLWAARLITIRGVIALNDKAAVETKRKALAKLLAQGKNEDLELKFVSEAGNTYTTKVRTTNCTMALQRVFWRQEYQIQLRANDPLIYDDGGSELIAILRVMAGEGGFEIPFDIPFDIGGSITPTSIDVGDEATYPLIRLKGDLHSPTIINMTTNQQMQVLADIITTVEWHDYTTTYTTNGYTQITSDEDGAPLSLTHLYGNAEQNGTPTPDAPIPVKTVSGAQTVKITGKNILPTITGSATQSGVSLTSTNGNITASGTATANMTFTLTGTDGITYRQAYWQTITASATNSVLLQKGTYYFSAGTTTAGNVSTQYRLADLGQKLEDGTSISLNSSFTITEPKRLCATIYVNNGNTPNVSISDLQLELGSQATSYEPYQSQSQVINLGGSNIFDISSATMANIYMNTNGWTSASNDWIGTDSYIEVEPNTTYTLSSSATAGTQVAINQYTSQSRSSFISPRIGTATFTTSATARYISFSIKDPNATNIMLNKGSTAQPYVPYTTYAYELAEIGTYQDYIWNDDGTWKIHKAIGKVVLDGSENWADYSAQVSGYYMSYETVKGKWGNAGNFADSGSFLNDHFTSQGNGWANYDGSCLASSGYATYVKIADSAISDVATLKTWLSTHNTTVYYALATPTDTEITDSELIEQLNHIYELYQGVNNVWLIPSAGAQGEMEVSYATEVDRDYHEVVIDCQARTVTQDGHNLYPALAEGSEFIRLVPGENKLYLTSEVESDNGTAEVKFKKGNISI